MNDSDWSGLVIIIIFLGVLAAWLTHVIQCLMVGKYLLLIAGGVIFPIGVIHGIGLWFGVAW